MAINIHPNARAKLNEYGLSESFKPEVQLKVSVTECKGTLKSYTRFCCKNSGELEQEVGYGAKLFFDAETEKLAKDYTLEFLEGMGGGFYFVRKTTAN